MSETEVKHNHKMTIKRIKKNKIPQYEKSLSGKTMEGLKSEKRVFVAELAKKLNALPIENEHVIILQSLIKDFNAFKMKHTKEQNKDIVRLPDALWKLGIFSVHPMQPTVKKVFYGYLKAIEMVETYILNEKMVNENDKSVKSTLQDIKKLNFEIAYKRFILKNGSEYHDRLQPARKPFIGPMPKPSDKKPRRYYRRPKKE
jgi:hypothetical protein